MNKPDNLTLNGHTYSFRKLNPITAMTLVLKLAPLMRGMTGVDAKALIAAPVTVGGNELQAKQARDAALQQAIGSLLNGLGELNEATVTEVCAICLGVVQRQLDGGAGWSPIWHGGSEGALAYEDIDLPEMLQIIARVLMDNLLSFTRALPQMGSPAGTAPK